MESGKVCRCCLSRDCSKELTREYFHGSVTEVYSEMLSSTFNIDVKQHNSLSNLICDGCVRSIRDASRFKETVEASEKTLLEMNITQQFASEMEVTLKKEKEDYAVNGAPADKEIKVPLKQEKVDYGDTGAPDDHDKGQIIVIELEPINEPTEQKDDTVKNVSRKLRRKVVKPTTERKKTEPRKKTIRNTKSSSETKKSLQSVSKRPPPTESQIASRENSLKLVQNSNMCLFKSLRTKFGCFHCKESFITMQELRQHTNICDNKNLKLRFNLIKGLSYKNVDISDLTCNNCPKKCDDLNGLQSHLTEEHSIEFNGDHFLIPYRLKSGNKCVLCAQDFKTYLSLAIHMNTHFLHYVCETCGVSYINRMSLRMHVNAMHKEKKCTHCSATFSSPQLRAKHMRKIHNYGGYKRYCLICNKTFRYTYLLQEHRIKEHGVERETSTCPECSKTFLTQQNLKVHISSVHLKERNYPCTVCGMRFITKGVQKRHERTHEDVRSFSCSFCEAKFKTKDSWRRHLKRQHGHLNRAE